MLPLYTSYLTQNEYGISDLVLTTVSLLLPIMTISIFDAVLRFTMDPDSDSSEIFTNGFVLTCFVSLIVGLSFVVFVSADYIFGAYVSILLVVQLFQVLFSQFLKGIGKVRIFAVNGIVLTLLTAIFNIIFLVNFSLGLYGYMISLVLAYLLSNSFLFFIGKLVWFIDMNRFNKKKLFNMITYSFPLIPNSIALWINNVANRYFILFFLGVAANGIFAVSNKMPTLLGVVNTIFFQAWQISAIEQFNEKDTGEFYSKNFSFYSKVMFTGCSMILLILRPLMDILISDSYSESWRYVPLLLMSVLYSSFSGFIGQYYIASKRTKGVFLTTIYGAICNIILNLILIPIIGLHGAGLSSCISFSMLWLIRFKDTQKFVVTQMDWKNIILNHIVIFAQVSSLLFLDSIIQYFISIVCVLLLLYINRSPFILLLISIRNVLMSRSKG